MASGPFLRSTPGLYFQVLFVGFPRQTCNWRGGTHRHLDPASIRVPAWTGCAAGGAPLLPVM